MLPECTDRRRWGAPVPIDPILLVAADDIYRYSPIFADEEIETANTAKWEDRDYLSADWFVRKFSVRNLHTKSDAPKGHHMITRLWMFQMSDPTIGEMTFVSCRYPNALQKENLPSWGDPTETLIKGFHRARDIFPEYEALGWALLHNRASGDDREDTFESEDGFAFFRDKGIPFDTVAEHVNHGILSPRLILKAVEHGIDPHYFGTAV